MSYGNDGFLSGQREEVSVVKVRPFPLVLLLLPPGRRGQPSSGYRLLSDIFVSFILLPAGLAQGAPATRKKGLLLYQSQISTHFHTAPFALIRVHEEMHSITAYNPEAQYYL